MLSNTQGYSITMEMDASGGRIASNEPNVDDLRSFSMVFRHFTMKNSHVYLPKIYNLCLKEITSDILKNDLLASRQEWLNEFRVGGFALEYNGRQFSPEDIMDLWINGHYLHDDTEKMRLLKSLAKHESILFHYKFIDFLWGGAGQVFKVGK